jgi:hypothetical protein
MIASSADSTIAASMFPSGIGRASVLLGSMPEPTAALSVIEGGAAAAEPTEADDPDQGGRS